MNENKGIVAFIVLNNVRVSLFRLLYRFVCSATQSQSHIDGRKTKPISLTVAIY